MNTQVLIVNAELAEQAGFTEAAKRLNNEALKVRKLAIAYEHFRYVTREQVRAFVDKLHASTRRRPTIKEVEEAAHTLFAIDFHEALRRAKDVYDTLVFDPIGKYAGMPPAEVMEKVVAAKAKECFDELEVAHVQPVATRIVLPDPIVFGRIHGCGDYFFIAEWGDDVKLGDLMDSTSG